MDCTRVAAEEIVERYLLGRLTDQDREAYEAHFFECDRCFEELRTLQAMQAEMRTVTPMVVAPPAPRRSAISMWVAAAVLILAVAVGFWYLGRSGRLESETTQARPPASQPAAGDRSAVLAARVAELARVEPPAYVPLTVRSADDTRARFDNAMVAYATGRYADAVSGLEAVVERQPAAAIARFFLGICYLMLDRTDAAIAALQQCVDTRDPAYAEDARFFLAKAFLRKGDRELAARALDEVARSKGSRADEARDLRTRLAAVEQQ